MLFLLDIAVALLMAVLLTELLVRIFRLYGPWQHRGSLWLVAFLVAWSAGIWFAPRPIGEAGWIAYTLPFLVAGLIAALVIALTSPLHGLTTPAVVAPYAPGLSTVLETRPGAPRALGVALTLSLVPLLVGQVLRVWQARG